MDRARSVSNPNPEPPMKALTLCLFLSVSALAQAPGDAIDPAAKVEQTRMAPMSKKLSVVHNIFSGRPNPPGWLVSPALQEDVVAAIEETLSGSELLADQRATSCGLGAYMVDYGADSDGDSVSYALCPNGIVLRYTTRGGEIWMDSFRLQDAESRSLRELIASTRE